MDLQNLLLCLLFTFVKPEDQYYHFFRICSDIQT